MHTQTNTRMYISNYICCHSPLIRVKRIRKPNCKLLQMPCYFCAAAEKKTAQENKCEDQMLLQLYTVSTVNMKPKHVWKCEATKKKKRNTREREAKKNKTSQLVGRLWQWVFVLKKSEWERRMFCWWQAEISGKKLLEIQHPLFFETIHSYRMLGQHHVTGHMKN